MIQIPAFVQAVPSPIPVAHEHRQSPRHDCDLEAVSCPLDAPETLSWGATVRDLSTGGVGLTICYPFKLGTYLAINLDNPKNPRTLLGRVIHVADQADGTWFIGCEFVKPIENVVDFLA